MVAITQKILAYVLQLVDPGRTEHAFQDQSGLVIALDNGNPEHSDLPISEGNCRAKWSE